MGIFNKKRNKEIEEREEVKLLCVIGDDFEADILESILKSEGINIYRKYKGSGGYMKLYMGISNQGIEIYVMLTDYDKAKEIYIEYMLSNKQS